MGRLLAPPYDVFGPDVRAALAAGHPHNIVHLDQPAGEGDQKYEWARTQVEAWVAGGVLREDAVPAIYRYEQRFVPPGGGVERRRRGFVALLRLRPFADRVVLPHERTLSGPKLDRAKLLRATRAHFSQVFTLFRDPDGRSDAAFAAAEAEPPEVDAVTPDGCRHRLWVVSHPGVIAELQALLAERQLLIADGHHRYETMVGLRDELRPVGAVAGHSLCDWAPVFFARAEDPGLLVLPTHRLLHDLPDEVLAALPGRAAAWFDVQVGPEATAPALEAALARAPDQDGGAGGGPPVVFAFRQAGRRETLWFRLRADADLSPLGPAALRGLDVTVLHGLLLGPLLGIDAEALARQSYLAYTHEAGEALRRLEYGVAQAAFFMNPTRVEQVLTACEAGAVLPQKSTYFEPKLATGLVMARLDPSRSVVGRPVTEPGT